MDDPTNGPMNDLTNDPMDDPTNDPMNNPTNDPNNDPMDDPTNDPMNDPNNDPMNDPTKDPVNYLSKPHILTFLWLLWFVVIRYFLWANLRCFAPFTDNLLKELYTIILLTGNDVVQLKSFFILL